MLLEQWWTLKIEKIINTISNWPNSASKPPLWRNSPSSAHFCQKQLDGDDISNFRFHHCSYRIKIYTLGYQNRKNKKFHFWLLFRPNFYELWCNCAHVKYWLYRQPGQVRTCGASRNGVGQVGTEAFTALFGDLSQIKSYPVESIDLFYNIYKLL